MDSKENISIVGCDGGLVSIAMCTFNGEQYLVEQLDSIVSQSYTNLEIVIVDDCSSDGTVDILKKYAKCDRRIRLICNDENLGFVRNFEKAINECRGEFIALADQDDIWFDEKISRLVADIGENWLIYSKVAVIDSGGVRQDVEFPTVNRLEGYCALSLILNNCVTGHACLMRRELLELAMPAMSKMPYHDQWLAIVAASRGKLKAGSEILSLYRKHNSNAVWSAKSKRRIPKYVHVSNKIQKTCDFISLVISSGVLDSDERGLLEILYRKYIRNDIVFFNYELKRFLLSNHDKFLGLFKEKERYVKRLCRGKWYFILIPFA
ncbi:glycosyltransferase family 2 protein [Zhongshania aquimaris]|uniref:Glycosyltransferase family 2 protein n=1 Tax=Zhongshania aquimaris TaxID=2857107 RepID=A0ABS6VVB6_9GAMM|nr:glycosyltransferase family 2 protein [Zhongshania aquimaris]MBW2942277.1 glycosyltransferase family 2 protein [Zhongshania aquimaris]